MELETRSLPTSLRPGQLIALSTGRERDRCTVRRIEPIHDARQRLPSAGVTDRCLELAEKTWPRARIVWLSQPTRIHHLAETPAFPVVDLSDPGERPQLINPFSGDPMSCEILQSRPEDN